MVRWICSKMCARKNMIFLSWVLFAVPAISKTIRGTMTIKSQVGSNVVLTWTLHNRTGDLIYIKNNYTNILAIWPEKNTFYPESEYKDRMEFSFALQDQEIQLVVRLKNISKDDEGLYTAYSQLNDEEIYTVDLIVTDGLDNITFVLNETTIHEFDSLTITCLADCYQSCSFQWIKHGDQDIPEMLVSDLATMHIPNTTRKDAGNYSCTATNTVTNKSVTDNITLEVMYGPDNITFVLNETTYYEFGPLTVTCLADCYLSCSFQWIKHSVQDIPEKLVSDLATMQISNTTRKDAGNYSCIATNTVTNKNVTDNITLEVIYGPDNITFVPNESTIYEFGALHISCLADCYLSCSFKWIKHGDFNIPEILVSDLATMQIPNTTRKDSGNYSCTATNIVTNKSVTDTITLKVIYGPNLVYFNEVKRKNHLNMAQFKTVNCFADCYPPCEYSVFGPGVDIVNSKDYFYNVTEKGTYVCRAVNPIQRKASGAIFLTISHESDAEQESPLYDTTGTPVLTNILLGTAVFLMCLICGFLIYKARKRFYKPNSNNSTDVEVGPPDVDLRIDRDFELGHIEIDPTSNYWTIDEDKTGGLHTVIDEKGASASSSLGLRSCPTKKNMFQENLEESCLQSDENAYIHPI